MVGSDRDGVADGGVDKAESTRFLEEPAHDDHRPCTSRLRPPVGVHHNHRPTSPTTADSPKRHAGHVRSESTATRTVQTPSRRKVQQKPTPAAATTSRFPRRNVTAAAHLRLHGIQTPFTMVSPLPLSPSPSYTKPPLIPHTDGPLQLPVPTGSHPPLHLHVDVRALRLPQHHRQPQGELLHQPAMEVCAHWRAVESVCELGVLCYGGECYFVF